MLPPRMDVLLVVEPEVAPHLLSARASRIVRIPASTKWTYRPGDGAELAKLELVGTELVKRAAERAKRREERLKAVQEGREGEQGDQGEPEE